jgi:hypothetical protein
VGAERWKPAFREALLGRLIAGDRSAAPTSLSALSVGNADARADVAGGVQFDNVDAITERHQRPSVSRGASLGTLRGRRRMHTSRVEFRLGRGSTRLARHVGH